MQEEMGELKDVLRMQERQLHQLRKQAAAANQYRTSVGQLEQQLHEARENGDFPPFRLGR